MCCRTSLHSHVTDVPLTACYFHITYNSDCIKYVRFTLEIFIFHCLTSRGLPAFAGRSGLSLIRVAGSIQLYGAQVQQNCLLEIIYHNQAISIAKDHTTGKGGNTKHMQRERSVTQQGKGLKWAGLKKYHGGNNNN